MKKIAIFAVLAAACAAPSAAAGNGNNGATLGDCISDGFYGNEPNIEPFAPGGPTNRSYTPKGKPAEKVLKDWLAKGPWEVK